MSNYHQLKRFMYGALVCFTKDNFNSLIFGQVVENNPDLLNLGQVIVSLNEDVVIKYKVDYVMVECTNFFEPYYHVLKALQNMNTDNFPMERYIVHVDSEINKPKYLKGYERYNIDGKDVPICDNRLWPSAENLNLNHTQYAAFKAALTNEFAIIQGPPGTGKTYLGLKIVKTLLTNKTCWYNYTPILIVCYTNHALDQFVEGLIDTTSEIVRIGSQSKNDSMKQFSLFETSRRVHQKQKDFGSTQLFYQKKNERDNLLSSINGYSEQLDSLNSFSVVADFTVFEKVDPAFRNSWFASATNEEIIDWLLGGRNYKEQSKEGYQLRLEEVNLFIATKASHSLTDF